MWSGEREGSYTCSCKIHPSSGAGAVSLILSRRDIYRYVGTLQIYLGDFSSASCECNDPPMSKLLQPAGEYHQCCTVRWTHSPKPQEHKFSPGKCLRLTKHKSLWGCYNFLENQGYIWNQFFDFSNPLVKGENCFFDFWRTTSGQVLQKSKK